MCQSYLMDGESALPAFLLSLLASCCSCFSCCFTSALLPSPRCSKMNGFDDEMDWRAPAAGRMKQDPRDGWEGRLCCLLVPSAPTLSGGDRTHGEMPRELITSATCASPAAASLM
eukprot:768694-Hanusia_phi.AAC.12